MKRLAIGIIVVGALIALTPEFPGAQDTAIFTGELMDAVCAPTGSHEMAMKANDLTTPLQCVWFCLHFRTPGSRLVLYDRSSKVVYNLDDMGRCGPPLRCLRPWSAERVKLTGTLDKAKNTIHVLTVESAP